MKKTAYSDSFKVFLGLCSLLILGNLFLANDYATLWNGTESSLVATAQNATVDNPVAFLIAMIYEGGGLSVFKLRLPGVLFCLGTAILFFVYGKKIFGRDAVVLTLLVAASTFLLIPLSKMAGGDIYLLFAQIPFVVFSILFVKQPLSKWRNAAYFFMLLGLFIHPLSMGIFGAVFLLLLSIRHKKKENVKQLLIPFGLTILVLPLVAYSVWGSWDFSDFTMSFGQLSVGKAIGFMLIGMLPWLGFLPAAFLDLFKKGKKGEEMATIIMAWLAASLVSLSLSFVMVLSFMIAKQVWVVLKPGYPYLRLVKGFALLNLISIFIIVFLALFGGISWVGVEGYRPLLGMCFIYWVFSCLAVLGLFMKDRRVVIGGSVFSGLITMMIFWISIYPKWEEYRRLPQDLISKASKQNKSGVATLTLHKTDWMSENFMVYAKEAFSKIKVETEEASFKQQLTRPNHQIFVFDNNVLTGVDSTALKRGEFLEVAGGWGRMGTGVWIVGE